jgi:hypothetical protein
MMKKGEQVLENIKDFVVLELLSKGLCLMGPNMRKHSVWLILLIDYWKTRNNTRERMLLKQSRAVKPN